MKFVMDEKEKVSVNTRDMVFLDLDNGDVFMNENQELFIRSEVFRSEFEEYNAVNLGTGEIVYFDEGDKVWKYEIPVEFNPNAFNNRVIVS